MSQIGKFGLWTHFPDAEKVLDSEGIARAHVDFQKRYNLTFIKFSPHQKSFEKIFNPQNKKIHLSELSRININEDNQYLKFYLKSLRALVKISNVPVLATLFSPITIVKSVTTKKEFNNVLHHNNKVLTDAVDNLTRNILWLINSSRIRNRIIFFANQISGIENYDRFVEYDNKILRMFKSGIYHIHGYSNAARNILESQRLPMISWESDKIKINYIGDKIPVNGIDRDALFTGNFKKITKNLGDLLNKRPDAIIGSNCALREKTPDEYISKVSKIAGKYLQNHLPHKQRYRN